MTKTQKAILAFLATASTALKNASDALSKGMPDDEVLELVRGRFGKQAAAEVADDSEEEEDEDEDDSEEEEETEEKPEKKAPKNGDSKYLGKKITYGGGKAKILKREDSGHFQAKALTAMTIDGEARKKGARFTVSSTYVYRQLA